MLEARKVIRQILLIYLTTTGVFLGFFFALWYNKLYEELLLSKSLNLRELHRNIIINIANSRFIPLAQSAENIAKDSDLKFAIIDENKTIFDNLDFDFSKAKVEIKGRGIYDNKVFFLAPMSSSDYFLRHGEEEDYEQSEALRILIQGEDVSKDLFIIRAKVWSFALLAFMLLALIAYFLVKIALKPLEDKINTLNHFIKDSTHEINTPLSVILMSIEQLQKQNVEQSDKFIRIKLAAKTLSQIYADLVFYNFPSTLSNDKEKLNLKNLIIERLEYFKLFFEQKKIKVQSELEESSIFANKNQILRLVDNLLSNAIKYNKKGGKIDIQLSSNSFRISDTGCGIAKKNLKLIFEKYARFNTDQGGFGIGLSLVKKVCDENHISLSCESKENEGTSFFLKW